MRAMKRGPHTHTHTSFVYGIVGAVPPWLQDDPLEGTSGTAAHAQIGPSLQDFLKHSKNQPDISPFNPVTVHPQNKSVCSHKQEV